MKTETDRPELSFDGCGINGPDIYRSRVATFTSELNAKEYGPLLASAPELLSDLEDLVLSCDKALPYAHPALVNARATIAKAKGEAP